ncbi:aKG-HExxH-type peptide beta-hydroxylase [Spirillospora sp. CA-294931]|uniref:aKG-HExxH-type peptide beta-hydroxylase n=1 Tax=Spirillospora sp. CA-294931 TaxID=3240042 RepID=UPI003D8DB17D
MALGLQNSDLVTRLRGAELSRRLILVEAIRRRIRPGGARVPPPPEERAAFEHAFAALARHERSHPARARSLLARPQVGVWAVRCLRALETGTEVDLAYLTRLMNDVVEGRERAGPPRLRIAAGRSRLEVVLDGADPYLDVYGPRAGTPDAAATVIWRRRLAEAMRSLARYDPVTAGALAAGLDTVVPLVEGEGGRPAGASSGMAFGAVALSLPPDARSCLDGLVHEFQHVLLGAVIDHFPLLTGDRRAVYSPWREDPRPLSGLLAGCHAQVALLDLWSRGGEPGRFARWIGPTTEAARTLWTSGALTEEGRVFVGAMRARLTGLAARTISGEAARVGADAANDHRLRWRLRNLRPDGGAMDALADAWQAGAPPIPVPTEVRTGDAAALAPGRRSRLLELGCGGYGEHPGPPRSAADRALLAGRYGEAAEAYKSRLGRPGDLDAWAGLALCRTRTDPASALGRRPEVVAGLHGRLLARTGRPADPDRLGAWLARGPA